jgi:hypothetical protein
MACQFDSRVEEITDNLVTLYNRSSNDYDIVQGEQWYPEARRIVQEWSATYGYHPETVACVIAAISPQCPWERNLIIADDILAHRVESIGSIESNIRKAKRIRDFENVCFHMREVFPYGPKVNNFARNLSGDDTVVTVDTHAMQAALNDVKSTYTLKWAPYNVFARCYVDAAKRIGRAPAEFQAIIWHTWKRLNPPVSKRNKRRQWEVIGEY